jgi:transcriptional regulator with XRE-family HTH domain
VSATAQTTFKPNAKKIVEHRKRLGWSRRAFASESGADEKTIRAIEEGRRDVCQPDTLQKFAAAFEKGGLACTWTDLVLSDTAAPKLPPRSSLDPLVKAERRLAKQPRLTTQFGPLKRFGASELADTFTAYGVHEGKRYYVDGTIEHQRGLSDADCQVLQVRGGHGGKFELMRVIDPELDPLNASFGPPCLRRRTSILVPNCCLNSLRIRCGTAAE